MSNSENTPENVQSTSPVEPIIEKKEDLTQVQTLQQIAVSQGQKMPPQMTPEQFRGQLILSHHMGLQAVVPAFKKLSKHGKDRVFTALMQLPMADIPNFLNGRFEKEVYLGAQKLSMERSAIIFNRAKQESAMEAKATAETEKKRLQKIAISDSVSVDSKDDGTINPVVTESQEVIKI